jgi:ABC-type multidrug transport system fused ATPase/permease subunit
MAKTVKGADGKVYKQVLPSTQRKRTVEIVAGAISLVVSLVSLASGLGLASVADSFGGGGSYTGELMFGILLSIAAFALIFLINKKHTLVSLAIIILGIILLVSCGNFGIIGGILFAITGVIALIRK